MELKDAANQALIQLINTVTDAMTFLKGEIPIAVRELLTYYTAYHIVLMFLAIPLFALGYFMWRMYRKLPKRSNTETDQFDVTPFPHIGVAILYGASAWVLIGNVIDLLKITLAPRIWLIEYAAHLVK